MTVRPGDARPVVTLRPYQQAAITSAREMVRAKRADGQPQRALIVLPTGCGKTQTAISLVAGAVERAPTARVLWLAHRRELLTQPISAMARVEATRDLARLCGVVGAGRHQYDRQIVMASISTLAGRSGQLARYLEHGAPQLVIVDEAHHSVSAQYRAVIDAIDGASPATWIGLTATPERADKIGLSSVWGADPATVYSISDAIRDGYLCAPRFVDAQLELDDDVKERLRELSARGDDEAIGDLLLDAGVVPATVEAMGEHLGRSTQTGEKVPSIVFCANIKQASRTTSALCGSGWRAELVTGATAPTARALAIDDLSRGVIDVIVNVAVFTEGTDIPRVAGIVAARPFSSKPLWLQSVGRGLRLHDGKDECIVVDLGGAHKEHHGVLGVAVIGEEAGDSIRLKLAGITYELLPGQIVVIAGAQYVGAPVDDPDGPIFVRALPVVRAKARGTMPAGADQGLRVVPIAVGRRPPAPEEGPAKPIDWQPIDDHEAALGADVAEDEPLPISGREIRRVTKAAAPGDLTRERKPLNVAWVMARIGDQDVRVVGLSALTGHGVGSRFGALWVIEHGMADGEQGYLIAFRFVGRNGTNVWKSFDERLRMITTAPVPWASAVALASDCVRQVAREAGADEPWRSTPPTQDQVTDAMRCGIPWTHARDAQTAGWLHDLITRRTAETDPLGPELIRDWLSRAEA